MQPEINQAEIEDFINQLHSLPPLKAAWFVDQMRLMAEGEPNAIDGTVPIPAEWSELEGSDAA